MLVDFWAQWCGPCKMIGPVLEEISGERDDVVIAKMDIDENPETPTGFGVRSIPTMLIFKGGEVTDTRVGGMPEIVDEGRTGLLSAPADPIALSDAVSGLLGDTSLRASMGVECRRRAVDMFSWGAITRALLERYRQLVGVGD